MNSFTSLRTSSKFLRSSPSPSTTCKLSIYNQNSSKNINSSNCDNYFSYRYYMTTATAHTGIIPFRLAQSLDRHKINKRLLLAHNKNTCHIELVRNFKQAHSSNNQNKNEMSETTILLEEGLHIQEVPIAVRIQTDHPEEKEDINKDTKASTIYTIDPAEEKALIEGFNSYHSPQEVLRVLDTIPSNEITPLVAFSILKKLLELENNFGFRNEGKSWIVSMDNGNRETFTRAAIIARLINTIISSDNSTLLLDTLDILRSERSQHYNFFYLDSLTFNYRSELSSNVLVRATEGKLSLSETCRAVSSFGEIYNSNHNNNNSIINNSSSYNNNNYNSINNMPTTSNNNINNNNFKIDKKFIDKFAINILDKSNDVTINNIVDVFKTIQYFTKSQRLVSSLVEKKLKSLWWRLDSDVIAQICDIILAGKTGSGGSANLENSSWGWCISGQVLTILSRATSLNLHAVTDDQLTRILQCFKHQAFFDPSIEKSLGKYVKVKGSKIQSSQLILTIMDYCKRFGLRSEHVLEGVSDYIVSNEGKNLSPPQIYGIITGFGHLNFLPSKNRVKFWSIVENMLDDKFVQFPPSDILDVFLACTYLEKYPLNFVSRVFSPYFLDRINASEANYDKLQGVRKKLKLLDTSLCLDCGRKYGGPFLSKDFSAKNLSSDGRIFRTTKLLRDELEKITQQFCTVDYSIIIPSLPLNELYIADIMIIPLKGSESQVFNYIRNRINYSREGEQYDGEKENENDVICIIITLPEHITSNRTTLIGSQAMRLRHLQKLGYRVATIKYDAINNFRHRPELLEKHLKEILSALKCPGL